MFLRDTLITKQNEQRTHSGDEIASCAIVGDEDYPMSLTPERTKLNLESDLILVNSAKIYFTMLGAFHSFEKAYEIFSKQWDFYGFFQKTKGFLPKMY